MENLRLLRREKDITMKKLGKNLGLAESTISLYETGKRQPDFETLSKIAEYFNVSVDYLLGNSDIRNPYKEDPDSDLRRIERARRNMPQEEKERMMKVLEAAFDKYLPEK